MKYVYILIITLIILCGISCEEIQDLQDGGGGDSINTSTDTYTTPGGTDTYKVPITTGIPWVPCGDLK